MADNFHYGGQAVIEGVMMRGKKAVVTAVRCPGGDIAMDTQPLPAIFRGRVRKMPLLRGIVALIEALSLGIKALLYSANVSLEEEDEKISGVWVWVMVALSLGLMVTLFFLIPLFLTRLLDTYIASSVIFHLVEGLIRVVIFVAYLKLMTLFPDIRRVFAYHGAEHKVINTYEDGAPLEVASTAKYKTAHTRCGTSFLFVVLLIAIIVFALFGAQALWLMIVLRIVLIPLIAALGYEIIYFAARHTGFGLVTAVIAPGMWLQSLTTREPDGSQVEVALVALKKVLEIDRGVEAVQAAD